MPQLPLSPYAVSKLAAENYCSIYNHVYGLRTTSLRYFNVYGPRQDPNSEYAAVIPKFITNMIQDVPLTIYGDGEQSRDFTFVDDVVQANMKAALSSKSDGFVVNVGTGSRITLNELVNFINKKLGINKEPLHTDPREGDIRHSLADISLATTVLGYQPNYTIDKGLEKTIKFFEYSLEKH